jgi:hypothetical protein
MVSFVNSRNPAKFTAESIENKIFNIFNTKITLKNLSTFTTVEFVYFINGSSIKFTIPTTMTDAAGGEVTITPVISTRWPTFQGGQNRKKGTGKFVFDNGLSTEFSTPPFEIEVFRPA